MHVTNSNEVARDYEYEEGRIMDIHTELIGYFVVLTADTDTATIDGVPGVQVVSKTNRRNQYHIEIDPRYNPKTVVENIKKAIREATTE